jgi:hypothetical protein
MNLPLDLGHRNMNGRGTVASRNPWAAIRMNKLLNEKCVIAKI